MAIKEWWMSSWREPSKHLVGGAGVGAGAATGARMEDQREGQKMCLGMWG